MKDFKNFITHLRFEALTLTVLMAVLTHTTGNSLWWLLGLFLFFDIGMIGYALNPKLGALTYNISHNLSVPTLMIASGAYWDINWLLVGGFAWTFHIAVDRTLGFGLKHTHSFKHTHLGKIAKNK